MAAAAAVIAGCSKQEPADIRPTDATHEVYLTVKASSADTRTAISPDYAIRWAEGDAIGVFYNTAEIVAEQKAFSSTKFNGVLQNLKYGIASGHGTAAAAFACEQDKEHEHPYFPYTGNFQWQGEISQTTLYAYYPYYYDAVAGSAYNVEYMPFHLPTTQTGSLDEVAENDLAYASATISRGADEVVRGEADFRFKHLFSILEITVDNSLSDAVTVESVTVTAANDKALVGDCTLDLTTGEVTMGKRANSLGQIEGTALSSVLVSPDAGVTLQPKGSTTLYAVVAPCDLAGATVRVTTTAGYQDFTVTGITTEAGKYYRKSVALSDLTPNPVAKVYTIDFEDVKLGHESQNGFVDRSYDNVYSPLGADKSGWGMDDYDIMQVGTIYSAEGVSFNGFYYDEGLATWGGFGFSSNLTTDFASGYTYQFHAVSAGGSGTFSVVYDLTSTGWGPGYEPVIEFARTVLPVSVDVTNMAMLGDYMSDFPVVTFVGYRSGTESGSVSFSLVDVKEWTEVSLRDLGSIDRLVVEKSGNPRQTPFYVCLDNLKYTIAE
ncbi:MAG: hypothetical protein BHV70_02340 [Bacteroidales bacterium 55_9]|nr:MAG: hypothetical protein BHV70_02340 [Bacteroidales bacterium 55_9]